MSGFKYRPKSKPTESSGHSDPKHVWPCKTPTATYTISLATPIPFGQFQGIPIKEMNTADLRELANSATTTPITNFIRNYLKLLDNPKPSCRRQKANSPAYKKYP